MEVQGVTNERYKIHVSSELLGNEFFSVFIVMLYFFMLTLTEKIFIYFACSYLYCISFLYIVLYIDCERERTDFIVFQEKW